MSIEMNGGDLFAAAAKASPPLTVSGLAVVGVSLQEWVLIATLIYTVLQILLLVRNFIKNRRADVDAA